MSLARCFAVALVGVDGHVVEVEADLGNGIPGLVIIGLPDPSLNEAKANCSDDGVERELLPLLVAPAVVRLRLPACV